MINLLLRPFVVLNQRDKILVTITKNDMSIAPQTQLNSVKGITEQKNENNKTIEVKVNMKLKLMKRTH